MIDVAVAASVVLAAVSAASVAGNAASAVVTVAPGLARGLLWVIGGLLVVLLVALCIPFRVRAALKDVDILEPPLVDGGETAADTDPGTWSVDVDWLWGGVRFRARGGAGQPPEQELRVLGFRRDPSAGESDGDFRRERDRRRRGAARKQQPKRRSDLRGPRWTGRLVRTLLSDASWFVPRLWRALGVRVSGGLIYGFPDPFLTGISQAVLALVPWPSDLRLTPDFSRGRLSGTVRGRATTYPVHIVVVLVRTALRPAVRELWWPRVRSALGFSKTA